MNTCDWCGRKGPDAVGIVSRFAGGAVEDHGFCSVDCAIRFLRSSNRRAS